MAEGAVDGQGAVFLQILRPLNTEPDAFFALSAGALRSAGLPVRRARITMTREQLLTFPRLLPADLSERILGFVSREAPSTVIVNNVLLNS